MRGLANDVYWWGLAFLLPVLSSLSLAQAETATSTLPANMQSPQIGVARTAFANKFETQKVADEELSDLRGGYFTAAGAQFDFSANVQTLVNGQLALQSNLTWTQSGPALQQITGSDPMFAQSGSVITVANAQGSTMPSVSVQCSCLTGTTQVLTNLTQGALQNIVLNSASNQTIVQNTNVALTIYNFATWQQQIAQNALGAQLVSQAHAAAGFIGN